MYLLMKHVFNPDSSQCADSNYFSQMDFQATYRFIFFVVVLAVFQLPIISHILNTLFKGERQHEGNNCFLKFLPAKHTYQYFIPNVLESFALQ